MTLVEDTAPAAVVALLLDDLAPPRLGTLLRAARKKRMLTRRDVADRIGISQHDLRRYERGDASIPSSVVAALAECYGEVLTAQFATRVPVQVDGHHVVVGAEAAPIVSDDEDDVLGTYIGIVARLRQSKPGEPIALRTNDLVALSTALGQDPQHVEARIVDLLGCTPSEARSLHAELLRRKLVLPVAGLVTGLAVIAGVGVAAASPSAPANHSTYAVTQTAPAPSTTVAPKAEVPAAPSTTVAPTPTTAAAPAPVAPAATETAEAPVPVAEAKAVTPLPKPVITPDSTPMSIPPNETVTIIQP